MARKHRKKCGILVLCGRQRTLAEGGMVAREGIEPPTRGFSGADAAISALHFYSEKNNFPEDFNRN
jgi:hypothetical protein